MKRLPVLLGAAFLAVNLTLAALWFTVLHPGTAQLIGHADSSPVVSVPTSSATFVGDELLPANFACPRVAVGRVQASDHRITAQFMAAPAAFGDKVEATLPPCGGVHLAHAQFNDSYPTLKVESQIAYTGKSGTVTVLTIHPNDAAVNHGLYLGNPAGSLPDGTPVYSLQGQTRQGQTDTTSLSMVRWYSSGRIVSLVSSDVALSQLEDLAGQVHVN